MFRTFIFPPEPVSDADGASCFIEEQIGPLHPHLRQVYQPDSILTHAFCLVSFRTGGGISDASKGPNFSLCSESQPLLPPRLFVPTASLHPNMMNCFLLDYSYWHLESSPLLETEQSPLCPVSFFNYFFCPLHIKSSFFYNHYLPTSYGFPSLLPIRHLSLLIH